MLTITVYYLYFQLHNGVLPELPDTKCPVCNKEYQSFERQMKHIFELHQEYWQIFSGGRPLEAFMRQREVNQREKRFSCEICKKYYSNETPYLKHMATHPEMSNLKMTFWTCHVCQKVFTKLSFLERHMDMKADAAHKSALVDFKFSNTRSKGDVTAAQGSASQAIAPGQQQVPMDLENSMSRPVFPTANSIVTTSVLSKDSQIVTAAATSQSNTWKEQNNFPVLSAQIANQIAASFTSTSQPSSELHKASQKVEQNTPQSTVTFSSMNATASSEKSPVTNTSSGGTRELNANNDGLKSANKECTSSSSNAEQCKKAILSVPQGLCSPTGSLANQFPPNAVSSTRIAHDGIFPAVSSSYRPMTPLEQLALAGSSMMHNPSGLVPGFPMRSGHMALPPMSPPGMVAAHSHLPLPRLPDSSDQDDIASTLQNIANQVSTSK